MVVACQNNVQYALHGLMYIYVVPLGTVKHIFANCKPIELSSQCQIFFKNSVVSITNLQRQKRGRNETWLPFSFYVPSIHMLPFVYVFFICHLLPKNGFA